ncbi:hypothetical protein ISN45_Aa05g019970 [Arabidopsis thaliana x Arabidopsis arenosa]|uniref:Uncharacterized protein n=1 Tax=Arabidopsis thaliana x Arabidopsis arenosa TaxID=1240361 RepID=A0A8T1ZM65_9BRAS|nr:hypothetical protein ISN45_Aa05g019970 [Arabidopsis thaliana x Arabidopsis arenosa]
MPVLNKIIKSKPNSIFFRQLHNLLSQFSRRRRSSETLDKSQEMQNSKIPPFSEAKRMKISTPKQPLTQLPPRIGKKVSNRSKSDQVHAISHQLDMSPNSDSSSGNEYRALRRKYLLLEEDSFALERGLKEAEDEVKALEDEKLELLDKLVVMEGLVDP